MGRYGPSLPQPIEISDTDLATLGLTRDGLVDLTFGNLNRRVRDRGLKIKEIAVGEATTKPRLRITISD